MEVWWVGSTSTPARMTAALLTSCALVFLLTLTGGFHREHHSGLGDTLIETAVGYLTRDPSHGELRLRIASYRLP